MIQYLTKLYVNQKRSRGMGNKILTNIANSKASFVRLTMWAMRYELRATTMGMEVHPIFHISIPTYELERAPWVWSFHISILKKPWDGGVSVTYETSLVRP